MRERWRNIALASKRLIKILTWIEQSHLTAIGDSEFETLRRESDGVSERSLRQALRETGLTLSPLVEGVRQDSIENLARTLIALQHEYETAIASGNVDRARHCKGTVMTAKDHARLAARKHPEKTEMIEWMHVWLENPPVFDAWCGLKTASPAAIIETTL